MRLDRLSMVLGKRCTGYAVPGLDQRGRQWVHAEFEDGSKLSGVGADEVAAFRNLLARQHIRAVQ